MPDLTNEKVIGLAHPEIKQLMHQQVRLSNVELHLIVNDEQKLFQRICQLNYKGVSLIEDEKYEEAIIYLMEAEKTLEYGASCGKTIDRVLITTTLRNLSSIYQRLWELPVCLDYIEALMINLECYNSQECLTGFQEKIEAQNYRFIEEFTKIVNKRLLLGISSLQLSALSSQTGNHKNAKMAAKDSIKIFEGLVDILMRYEKITAGKNSQLLIELKEMFQFNCCEQKLDQILKETKFNLQRVKQHRHFFSFETSTISELSIGDIMQIGAITVEEANEDLQAGWFISHQGLIYQAIYISCAYFTLATQSRLLNQKGKQNILTSSLDQLVQSQLYHLHSINIASSLILLETNYLHHIVKSFKTNFSIDLQTNDFRVSFEPITQFKSISRRRERSERTTSNNKFCLSSQCFLSRKREEDQCEDEIQQISAIPENAESYDNICNQNSKNTKNTTDQRRNNLSLSQQNQQTIKTVKNLHRNNRKTNAEQKISVYHKKKSTRKQNPNMHELSQFVLIGSSRQRKQYNKSKKYQIKTQRSLNKRSRSKSNNEYGINKKKIQVQLNCHFRKVIKSPSVKSSRKKAQELLKTPKRTTVYTGFDKKQSSKKKIRKIKSQQPLNLVKMIHQNKLKKINDEYFINPSKITASELEKKQNEEIQKDRCQKKEKCQKLKTSRSKNKNKKLLTPFRKNQTSKRIRQYYR